MNPLKGLKNLIYKADFFYTTELFRYSEESDFRTITGGICSISIIGVIMALLIVMITATINRDTINFSAVEERQPNPSPMTLRFDGSGYMLGVELYGIDLNSSERYFDIKIETYEQYKDQNGILTFGARTIETEPCEPKHFNQTAQIAGNFNVLGSKYWLCPKLGQQFTIQGRYTNDVYTSLSVAVVKCDPAADLRRPCKSQSEVQAYVNAQQGQYFSIFFINCLINPSSLNLKTVFLDDRNFMIFSNLLTSRSYIAIEQYNIDTDNSLWPITSSELKSGPIVKHIAYNYPQQVYPDSYYGIYVIIKSATNHVIKISYNKFDAVVSYVGGLFGSIIGLMFIMKFYTQLSYELSIGSHVFSSDSGEPIKTKKFNILGMLGYWLYSLVKATGFNWKWKSMENYSDCKRQVNKQLDVKLLLERILFFQRALLVLFDESQFQGLHLQKKMTIQQAQNLRELYALKRELLIKENMDKNQEEQCSQKEGDSGGKLQIESLMESPSLISGFRFASIAPSPNGKFEQKVPPLHLQRPTSIVEIEDQIVYDHNIQRKQFKLDQNIILPPSIESIEREELENKSSEESYSVATKKHIEFSSINFNKLKNEAKSGDEKSHRIWKRMDENVIKNVNESQRMNESKGHAMKKSNFEVVNSKRKQVHYEEDVQ